MLTACQDYFLFHVESDGIVSLDHNVQSAGRTFSAGTRVPYGVFYDHVKTARKGQIFRKETCESVIPVGSVLYVCIELNVEARNGMYVLRSEAHEDIMCSLYA